MKCIKHLLGSRLKISLILISMLASINLYAQQIAVTGTIADEQGETMPGVNILIKGTTTGVITNVDGKFNINVPDANTVLQISFVGYTTQEITVGIQRIINVTLVEAATALDEVVVIGYGTAKRKDLTGSVSSVNAATISAIPVSSAVEAITGKLAGVQITSTEGSPDAEMKIRVRGGGSITGSNTPLMIVDGFPVESISDIPPSDIESIDVLKDGSSTAIYGSRGANGVILVTTKSGKEGKITVNYNAYVGWKKIAKTLDVLTPADYVKWQYERSLLADKPNEYTRYFGNYQDIDLYNDVPANNWQEQVFGRTGFTFNQNLSISGGGEKTKYAFSYNHINDEAIMQLSGYKRDNLSLKLNNKPNKRITLDFSMRYSNTQIDGGGTNEQNEKSSADPRLRNVMIYPSIPVKGLTDNTETDADFNLIEPLVSVSDNDRAQLRTNFNLSGGITWEIIDNLRFRTEIGLDNYHYNNDRFYGSSTYYVRNVPAAQYQGDPAVIFSKFYRRGIRNTNTLNYDFKKFMGNNGHNLNVMVGQEYLIEQSEELTSTVHGFPKSFSFSDVTKLSAQGVASSIENYLYPDNKLLSFFGRANYDFKSKYLLSATFRADGSSKFSEDNHWGYFPSVSAAWRISAEPFMESTRGWLTDLKLRASYGTAGNNNIPSSATIQPYETKNTSWVNGYNSYWAPTKTMANPDLLWETMVTRNLGMDITTLDGRLSSTIEVYLNNTKDLLIGFPTPGTGYDLQYRNLGKTQNKGLEITVNWTAIDQKDFGLSISGNIGFNRNKVKSLGSIMNDFTTDSGWASTEIGADYMTAVGRPVGQMYGYKSAGRYEVSDFSGYDAASDKWTLKDGVVDCSPVIGTIRPGSMKLQNLTAEDNLVNISDRTIIGDSNPLHTGGLTLNGRVYGFDVSASFTWSYGNDIYNANKIEYTSTSKYYSRNMIATMEDGKRWTNLLPDGTICNDPAQLEEMNENTSLWSPYMKQFIFSDWAVEDGSFLRLNTLTVGYTLPKELMQKIWIQNCRFYVTGYNVFCWTNYTGFDPEVSTRRKTALTPGVDYSAYPRSRSVVFGVNLSF